MAAVDGVLLLDKPSGITSNGALQRAKRLLMASKAGHVGTLDPLASGLLPICFGEATKFSTDTFSADKSYDAEILLGATTTTGDIEGEITSRNSVNVTADDIVDCVNGFTGPQLQMPPMYSALKRDGKALYAYARAGETVERTPRNITIHDITVLDISTERFRISVSCSKGTYIRVLAEDIGRKLGCGATLSALRRTSVAQFLLEQAVTLAEIEEMSAVQRANSLLPLDWLVKGLPPLELGPDAARRIGMGQATHAASDGVQGLVRLYDHKQRFLGLGTLEPGGKLMAQRLVASRAPANAPSDAPNV
jgi:tRNA pseudouridine55 synthase